MSAADVLELVRVHGGECIGFSVVHRCSSGMVDGTRSPRPGPANRRTLRARAPIPGHEPGPGKQERCTRTAHGLRIAAVHRSVPGTSLTPLRHGVRHLSGTVSGTAPAPCLTPTRISVRHCPRRESHDHERTEPLRRDRPAVRPVEPERHRGRALLRRGGARRGAGLSSSSASAPGGSLSRSRPPESR